MGARAFTVNAQVIAALKNIFISYTYTRQIGGAKRKKKKRVETNLFCIAMQHQMIISLSVIARCVDVIQFFKNVL